MEENLLIAQKRTVTGKQVKQLRRQGWLPAIIFGKHITPIPIVLDQREARRLLLNLSSSALVALDIEGTRHTTLVRELQLHPVSGDLLHADFLAVSLTEKLRTKVSLQFTGEAPAVKMFDGILVINQEELEVECLPADLPERIEVDLSGLAQIGDAIYVRDIRVSDKVEILAESDESVALITTPASEAELEGAPAAAEGEPEVIERGKKEEEF